MRARVIIDDVSRATLTVSGREMEIEQALEEKRRARRKKPMGIAVSIGAAIVIDDDQ